MNERGELYGHERLERLLAALPPGAAPREINSAVIEDVRRFVGEAPAVRRPDAARPALELGLARGEGARNFSER